MKSFTCRHENRLRNDWVHTPGSGGSLGAAPCSGETDHEQGKSEEGRTEKSEGKAPGKTRTAQVAG